MDRRKTEDTKPLNHLKALRAIKGLRQKDVANLLEMPASSYCYRENGVSDFTAKEAKKLIKILGATFEEIFFDL